MRRSVASLAFVLAIVMPMLLASCSSPEKAEGSAATPAPKADDDRGAAGRGRGEGAGGK